MRGSPSCEKCYHSLPATSTLNVFIRRKQAMKVSSSSHSTLDATFHMILAKTRAKKQGKAWRGHCPAHTDKSPSFSIDRGADGCILLHCHAGCDDKAVCAALGIKR